MTAKWNNAKFRNERASNFAERVKAISPRQVEIDGSFIQQQCIAYMALGEKDILYVGMSTKGLSRVFRDDHHVLGKIQKDIKSVVIFETANEVDARRLESMLIREFDPIHNDRQTTRSYAKDYRGKLNLEKVINDRAQEFELGLHEPVTNAS
jgi:hypothetical protein